MTGNAPIARRSRLKCCITPSPYTREERQYPTAFLYAAAAVRAERSVLPIRLRWLPLQRRDGAEGNYAREPVNEFRGRCLASTATQAPLQMLLWLQQLTQEPHSDKMPVLAQHLALTSLFVCLRVFHGAAVLLSIPTAIGLGDLGQPLIHLFFQHGAFNKHSSSLTYLALIGYLVGLTGHVAGDLLSKGFYALKDARTPLFTTVFSLLVRTGLIIFLLKLFVGKSALIAISLAASRAITAEALLR